MYSTGMVTASAELVPPEQAEAVTTCSHCLGEWHAGACPQPDCSLCDDTGEVPTTSYEWGHDSKPCSCRRPDQEFHPEDRDNE